MNILRSKTTKPKHHLILAHGAGAPMDSDWMNHLCSELSSVGIKTYRFEFPYMAERRDSGKKRPPNPARILEQTWLDVIGQLKLSDYFIGGKSMGGRIASHIMSDTNTLGLICYGFPFHAPGKDLSDRHKPMLKTRKPTFVIQGERDSMGDAGDLKRIRWPKTHNTLILPDGDHSLKPRKLSGFSLEQHLKCAAKASLEFMNSTASE